MSRTTRQVQVQDVTKNDIINIDGLGDCRVIDNPLGVGFNLHQFGVVSSRGQVHVVSSSPDAGLTKVEFFTNENTWQRDQPAEEEVEQVWSGFLRIGDWLYLGGVKCRVTRKRSFFGDLSRVRELGFYYIVSDGGQENFMLNNDAFFVLRIKNIRKPCSEPARKPRRLSFAELACDTYAKAQYALVKRVRSLAESHSVVNEASAPVELPENDTTPLVELAETLDPSYGNILKNLVCDNFVADKIEARPNDDSELRSTSASEVTEEVAVRSVLDSSGPCSSSLIMSVLDWPLLRVMNVLRRLRDRDVVQFDRNNCCWALN